MLWRCLLRGGLIRTSLFNYSLLQYRSVFHGTRSNRGSDITVTVSYLHTVNVSIKIPKTAKYKKLHACNIWWKFFAWPGNFFGVKTGLSGISVSWARIDLKTSAIHQTSHLRYQRRSCRISTVRDESGGGKKIKLHKLRHWYQQEA